MKKLSENNKPLNANPSEITNIINYLIIKYTEILNFSYYPNLNNKKILFLIASHTNTELKLNNVKTLINILNYENIDIKIANSVSLNYNNNLSEFCKEKNISYTEIENSVTYDFGKWIYLLSQLDYSSYDFVFFTNDSFTIDSPINHFINLTVNNNVELFGYNDSTEIEYHYQSYLFSIRSDAIFKFISMVESNKHLIDNQSSLILNIEVKMTNYFTTHDCFLKIGNFSFHKGFNIFFTNDYLYKLLKNTGILPFTKVKRITNDF